MKLNCIISNELRGQLIDTIIGFSRNLHPNPNASDYCCEFCGRTANTNNGDVTHKEDCEGMKMLNALHNSEVYEE